MSFPWYEVVSSDSNQLNQGDLIKACPIIVPPATISAGDAVDLKVTKYNVIIMSQSCDLVNRKITNVLVCSYITLGEFIKGLPEDKRTRKAANPLIKAMRDGLMPNYHMLDKDESKGVPDYLVVEFRNVFAVHISYLDSHITAEGRPDRIRLLPPYREQLSQAFAKFFMRVGLPQNIANIDAQEYLS